MATTHFYGPQDRGQGAIGKAIGTGIQTAAHNYQEEGRNQNLEEWKRKEWENRMRAQDEARRIASTMRRMEGWRVDGLDPELPSPVAPGTPAPEGAPATPIVTTGEVGAALAGQPSPAAQQAPQQPQAAAVPAGGSAPSQVASPVPQVVGGQRAPVAPSIVGARPPSPPITSAVQMPAAKPGSQPQPAAGARGKVPAGAVDLGGGDYYIPGGSRADVEKRQEEARMEARRIEALKGSGIFEGASDQELTALARMDSVAAQRITNHFLQKERSRVEAELIEAGMDPKIARARAQAGYNEKKEALDARLTESNISQNYASAYSLRTNADTNVSQAGLARDQWTRGQLITSAIGDYHMGLQEAGSDPAKRKAVLDAIVRRYGPQGITAGMIVSGYSTAQGTGVFPADVVAAAGAGREFSGVTGGTWAQRLALNGGKTKEDKLKLYNEWEAMVDATRTKLGGTVSREAAIRYIQTEDPSFPSRPPHLNVGVQLESDSTTPGFQPTPDNPTGGYDTWRAGY